jgi:hypothetical protein
VQCDAMRCARRFRIERQANLLVKVPSMIGAG